jgi:hypothetical protein
VIAGQGIAVRVELVDALLAGLPEADDDRMQAALEDRDDGRGRVSNTASSSLESTTRIGRLKSIRPIGYCGTEGGVSGAGAGASGGSTSPSSGAAAASTTAGRTGASAVLSSAGAGCG